MASSTSYVNQHFVGPGTVPPQASLFASGSPIAPGTPYDFWTSSPNTSGFGIGEQFTLMPTYHISSSYDVSATFGYGALSGTGNVAAYWGDEPMPTIDPHLGSRALNLPVAFPLANKQDSVSATRGSLLSAAIGRHDGSFVVRGGWFDLAQGESFIFKQPPATTTPIAFDEPLPEGLGDRAPMFDVLKTAAPQLPLHGVDAFVKLSSELNLELTNAELPSPYGTHARVTSGSIEIDRGGGVTYGAELAHLVTGGNPVLSSVLMGGNPALTVDPQYGALPTSTLNAQRMVIGGLRASFPLSADTDAQLRWAMSCYGADGTSQSAPCTHGSYYYARLHHGFRSFDLAVEGIRSEATYATAILPYGTLENIWSAPFTWPGTWLKGTYQFVDNTQIGPNRQGMRVSGTTLIAGVEIRAAYAFYNQIRPYDASTAFIPGFVEGYFLPQLNAAGTLGKEQHASASFIAHAKFANVQLDLSDVTLSRAGSAGNANEAVAINYPSASLSLSRELGPKLIGSVGAGRYAVDGAFDTGGPKNADLAQRVVFAGLQWQQNPTTSWGLQYRLYSVDGLSTNLYGLFAPGPAGTTVFVPPTSPAYHGPQLLLEQRFRT